MNGQKGWLQREPYVPAVAIFVLTLASRVPFLPADPGVDPDAWRVVQTARELLTAGEYMPSRLPGYPVQEFASALALPFGIRAVNALTAVMSAVAAGFFCLTLRNLGARNWVLAGAALAFVPVVYVNSTTAMDYVWALGFAMVALFFCTARRPLVAGVFLGLAIGCRITSAALFVPLALVLWSRLADQPLRHVATRAARLGASAAIIATICFAPVLLVHGAGFLIFYESGYPDLADVWQLGTVEVWGRIGLLAVTGVTFHVAFQMLGPARFRYNRSDLLVLSSCLVAIIGYAMLYLRLPHESGYLIPIVPFVILLATKTLGWRLAPAFALLLIASPFVSFGTTGLYEGPVITDSWARERARDFAARARERLGSLEPGALVVVGSHQPSIIGIEPAGRVGADVSVVYFAEAEDLRRQVQDGRPIYYTHGMDAFEAKVMGIRLQDYGARELVID